VSVVATPAAASAVPIVVRYTDGPDEGFNDPTLGAERRGALEFATRAWSQRLQGTTPIVVEVAMDPLGGDGARAVLASTAATTVHRNFPGVPLRDTWYGAALATTLSGMDLNGAELSEIEATFNSDVDNLAVLGSLNWYYGTDAAPGTDIDFVTVALHELGHGLNFFASVDPGTGAWLLDDLPGIYDLHLQRSVLGPLRRLREPERLVAITSGALSWSGPFLSAALGRDAPIYAPRPYQSGSSLSHWDSSFSGGLMAPFYTAPNHDPGLLIPALLDMGWELTRPDTDARAGDFHGNTNAERDTYPHAALQPREPTTCLRHEFQLRHRVGNRHPYAACDRDRRGGCRSDRDRCHS
jgi:hypothetical protein